jgi:exopolysaccharide biosynthesis protein
MKDSPSQQLQVHPNVEKVIEMLINNHQLVAQYVNRINEHGQDNCEILTKDLNMKVCQNGSKKSL